jgi:iron(II)-dependent oxidoreductase
VSTSDELIAALPDARARTLTLIGDLRDGQWLGPRLSIVNPPLWEFGHVAWFHEFWERRHLRRLAALRADGDRLYDSAKVAHDTRWDLPLPSFEETREYATAVLDQALDWLTGGSPSPEARYFHWLGTLHEDMHGEAFTYTRQTLGYSAPRLTVLPASLQTTPVTGDVSVPGGTFVLGATQEAPFVFDNEKWAHPETLEPFRIARTAVTNVEMAGFVEDGGYARRDLWSDPAWRWREGVGARHPVYWRQRSGHDWEERVFDTWIPLRSDHPAIHVSWYEAEAYCRWAGRRLPTELEWEAAAASASTPDGRHVTDKRTHPWGNEAPASTHANLDAWYGGTVSVHALAPGDSAFGCRQMCGNVWEWTADAFAPYPGFVIDPYKEYSAPWFGDHKVLRGGCWATRARLIRNTWRNFYTPDRRDVLAGFRTCAA